MADIINLPEERAVRHAAAWDELLHDIETFEQTPRAALTDVADDLLETPAASTATGSLRAARPSSPR